MLPSAPTGDRRTSLRLALGWLVASSLVAAAGAAAAREVYRVDPELTSVVFAVSHNGLSTQRGQFGRTRGTIVLDPQAHSGRIDFVVDAASVDTGWPPRDAFIRGEDMFDSAHYPVVRFRSTSLAYDGDRLIAVAGELTMHSVTRPVELHVVSLDCGKEPDSGREGCGAEVETQIKRSDFGMTYALGIVGDDVGLQFQVTAFRVPPEGETDQP
ncbi:MAG TPA: YceI family protein [Casimicrobiaceae bacterium]|nr:YceI family protein [Casimicrobiaceae bacterium]